jgi:hypothetical protein
VIETVTISRHRVVVWALALVACQVVAAGVAPVVLACRAESTGAAIGSDEECTCAHTPGAVCPMHQAQKTKKSDARPDQPRWCNGCADPADAIVPMHLTGPASLPGAGLQIDRPDRSEAQALVAAAPLPAVDRTPVAPPPRS